MTLSARDVAAALCDRRPGLPATKLHTLLYYCQGHHLAAFDEPLFSETISVWDTGPVVGNLWYAEEQGDVPKVHREMNEAQLNTVGYVLSRYGTRTGQSSADGEEDNVLLDTASVTLWLQGAEKRREDPVRPDRREEIMARLEELRARLPSRA
jgi:hypothetical protein